MVIIKIDPKTNRVVSAFEGTPTEKMLQDENKFVVESLPEFAPNKDVYYDPESKTYCYKERSVVSTYTEEQRLALAKAKTQRATALKWLSDNDWKVNKRSLGEWTEDDPRWVSYLTERATMRCNIDAADAIIADITKTAREV